jgi:subtilisin family serine protease
VIRAKLKDPNQPVPGLNVGRTIGQIVTGTVAIADIESVRTNDNVISLKQAKEVYPTLQFSVHEIRATQDQLREALPADLPPVNGTGVIVGVVDYDIDFMHNNFRNPDGTTRLLYLWEQWGGRNSSSPTGFGYGREFNAAQINAAIQSSDPYQHLAYQPETRAHGTHVMDIVAGNGRATGRPGVAPAADLIFVQINGGDFTFTKDISWFSSQGPTRDGRQKPEVSAPGHFILATNSLTQGATRMSGTSMAAPHVTGAIALLMQAANRKLAIAEIRNAIMNTARKNPPAGEQWNGRYGVGRVDATAAILTQMAPPTPSPEVPTLPTVVHNGSAAILNGAEASTMTTLISGIAQTARKLRAKVRLQVEVEPLDK